MYKISSQCRKNDRVLVLWRSKTEILRRYLGFLYFPEIPVLSDYGRSKLFLCRFRVLDKKKLKACITPPKMLMLNLTFPWLRDLEWPWPQKLRMILWSIPDSIHVVVLAYFHLIRLWCATKLDTPNRQTFILRPDLLRIADPKVKKKNIVFVAEFPRSIKYGLFFNRANISLVQGGGQKIAPPPSHLLVALWKYPCQERIKHIYSLPLVHRPRGVNWLRLWIH